MIDLANPLTNKNKFLILGVGFSGSFSGKQNIVAEINDEKISTQEFVNYLRTVNITYEDMEKVGKYKNTKTS